MAVIVCSIAALVWLLAARALGPSDLWHQTQAKTVSYTTDIIINGGARWILPVERGELPATKPPMYNWLAAPAVRWLGFDSEIAHKLPSAAALMACWLIVVRFGRWLGRAAGGEDETLGWLAGLILLANYSTFKLGYLARPDMLLTLWLLIAWWSATAALLADGAEARPEGVWARAHPRALALVFWIAIALAGLTKGPAALVGVMYALAAARVVGGRWSAVRTLRPAIGLLITGLLCGAWVFAVWRIDPVHLREQLWFNEFYGRITGQGAEGTHHGSRRWFRELPYQGAYYMTRFVPWSFLSLVALAQLAYLRWRRRRDARVPWAEAGALFALITIALFSLSTGKRADYIAVAFPQAALLVAWWLRHGWGHVALRVPWLAPLAAAAALAACTWYNQREPFAPQPGFGEAIMRFARDVNMAVEAEPLPVYPVGAGQSHLQAMVGVSSADARRQLGSLIADGGAFWVLAGRTQNPPHEFDQWLSERHYGANVQVERRATSAMLPASEGWPEQVTLWHVRPTQRDGD